MENCELPTIDMFNKLVDVFPEFVEWTKQDVVEIKKFFKKDSIVLDVGCGWGREIKELARFCKKIIALDNDAREIETAKSYLKNIHNVEFSIQDAKKTSFPDESFDVIISVGNTFGNLGDDKEKVLQEMKRLVKNDGKILLSVYSNGANSKRTTAYKSIGLKIKTIENGKILFEDGLISEEFSKEELKNIFEKFQLKVRFINIERIAVLCIVSK
jgi:2-polyprenyl-6-hydroxyphenyl methylase/3-demethylubiquinone-9 3-methyltransferase